MLSFKCGYEKPDLRKFSFLRKTIGIDETGATPVFVDDDEKNVIAARECGFNAHLFANVTELLTMLKSTQ